MLESRVQFGFASRLSPIWGKTVGNFTPTTLPSCKIPLILPASRQQLRSQGTLRILTWFDHFSSLGILPGIDHLK
jgi:hypothetical protein